MSIIVLKVLQELDISLLLFNLYIQPIVWISKINYPVQQESYPPLRHQLPRRPSSESCCSLPTLNDRNA